MDRFKWNPLLVSLLALGVSLIVLYYVVRIPPYPVGVPSFVVKVQESSDAIEVLVLPLTTMFNQKLFELGSTPANDILFPFRKITISREESFDIDRTESFPKISFQEIAALKWNNAGGFILIGGRWKTRDFEF